MGLVFLVDDGGGGAETLPDGVAEFLGHGAVLLPLLMQLLELLEGAHHVLALGEGLGLLAELGLGLEVLAEVQVAEFAVDLHEVVELLHVQLVGIVHIPEILLGNRTDLAPAVLDLAELREGVLHVALLLDEGLQVLDDGLLLHKVGLALGIELAGVLRTLLLIGVVEGLEARLDRGERAQGGAHERLGGRFLHGIGIGFLDRRVLAGFRLFTGEPLVEGGLDGLGLLGTLHPVGTFRQFLEQSGQLGKGLLAIVDHGLLDFLHDFLHLFLRLFHDFLRFLDDFLHFLDGLGGSLDNFFHSLFHGFLGLFLCYI